MENEEIKIYKCTCCGEDKLAEEMRMYRGEVKNICKKCFAEAMLRGKEQKRVEKVTSENGKQLTKLYTNPSLASFSPRQLMDELVARGYHGELNFVQKIKL